MVTEIQVCADCDEDLENVEESSVLECGNCGEEFAYADEGSTRCPSCGKFAAKKGDGHAGCTALNDEAETKYKCDVCDDHFDTEKEAQDCEAEHKAEEAEVEAAKAEGIVDDRGVRFVPQPGDTFELLNGEDWDGRWGEKPCYLTYRGWKGKFGATWSADGKERRNITFDTTSLAGSYGRGDDVYYSWGSNNIRVDPKSLREKDGLIVGLRLEMPYGAEHGKYLLEMPLRMRKFADTEARVAWMRSKENEDRKAHGLAAREA